MDSSESPTYGEHEGSAYNGHFGCTCYHPLFVFNQLGDVERCALHSGNVHSVDGWRTVVEPVVARYREVRRLYFRGDAAFANPDINEFHEAERIGYAASTAHCELGGRFTVAQDAPKSDPRLTSDRNPGNVGQRRTRGDPGPINQRERRMKKTSLHLGLWARLFVFPTSGDTRTATGTLPHPQTMKRMPALIAALAICGMLGGISLLFPPFIHPDSTQGFLAWRGTLLGAANSIITPNPATIAQDTAYFLAWYSPGQYLIPGAISLLGVPLGIAMTLTVTLSMLAALSGWFMIVRKFAPRTSLAVLVTLFIGSFPYSTAAFGIYHGGEILLQAATPWLILTAYRVPEMNAVSAGLMAAAAVFLAFLAKLTGLIVVAAALMAANLVVLSFGRRITHGMLGGALGALAALAILYVTFLSMESTPVSHASWSLPFKSIAFAALAPWVAGISWGNLMSSIFLAATPLFDYHSPIPYLLLTIPPALLVIGLVLFWRPQTITEKKLKLFSLWFYGVVATVFSLMYVHGGVISLEQRHFRSAGTLLFVCALMSALAAGIPSGENQTEGSALNGRNLRSSFDPVGSIGLILSTRWTRGLFLVLCVVMTLFGLASFSHHVWTTANGRSLDRTSWTNQWMFDPAAVDFARDAYAQEGRDALFVLPWVLPSNELAVTLPIDARILSLYLKRDPDFRYSGRVPGHIFVLMPNTTLAMSEGPALLSIFTDYAPDAWKRKTFANMSVFFQ